MTRPAGALFAASDPAAARLAKAISWLWRLGPPLPSPQSGAVGIGGRGDESELSRLLGEGRLAGAVVLGAGAGTERAAAGGSGEILRVPADPDEAWGRFGIHELLEGISDYLLGRLERPLVMLPRIGMLRIDDLPGTAQHQLEGRAKSDRRQRRRLRRYVRAFERADAVLNVAVPAQALKGESRVPLNRVWPDSIAALREGAVNGAVEAVCHGLLHLDTAQLERGAIEFREFAHLDEEEAGTRIDTARAWQEKEIGPSRTFVAPAWAYSEGSIAAAARRGLPIFTRCEAGETYAQGRISETLKGGLGIEGLNYSPLTRMAAAGLPPTMVLHGTLIDVRTGSVGLGEPVTALRLLWRRDLSRLPSVKGVRWLAASDYAEVLAQHDRIVFDGAAVRVPPGGQARALDRSGEHWVEGSRN